MECVTSSSLSQSELVAPDRVCTDNDSSAKCCWSWIKLRQILSIVTVEPVLFLYMLATFMQYSVFQDLVYQKTCHTHFNASICASLDSEENKEALDLVQKEASHLILSSTAALTIPSILTTNILGSYSDMYDRKWPLLLPPAGMTLAVLVYILMDNFESLPVWLIIVSSLISGLTGGFISIISGVTSYISAISSEESRTMRVGLMEAASFLSGTIGPFVGGGIFQASQSHTAVFSVILYCYISCVAYIVWCVPSIPSSSSAPTNHDYRRLFTCQQVKSSILTIVKPRPDHRRRNVLLLSICLLYMMTVISGEMDVAYLYVKDAQLNWSYHMYSYYTGTRYGLSTLTLLAFSPLACYWNLSDGLLAMIGLVSRMAGMVLLGLATTTAAMFAVPVVSLFSSFSVAALRAMLSKLVDSDELGKLFAFVASLENACLLFGSLIFNLLYPLTRDIYSGFVFELAALLLVVPLAILLYLEWTSRLKLRRGTQVNTVETVEPAPMRINRHGSISSCNTVTTEISGDAV